MPAAEQKDNETASVATTMELEGHGRGHKRRRLSGQATTQLVEEVDKQQEEEAPAPTCSICLQPWTCNGDHRICCIPCGHVYGRSCLEKWLLHAVLQRGTGQAKEVGEYYNRAYEGLKTQMESTIAEEGASEFISSFII
ncbi:uncharacterized protein [Oryza sativa Japonica Group]|uniref:uncharacterized protein n=1 Tax=Oryza sativa subsp. japonica TaxID=39947 RepID=UPI000775402F|nr:E3 ubiquitin-protein ligase RFWD3-like isoform X1 [Oryza sativa Japonica Group]